MGKLPSVLRIYCDTLASDIKTSIKITVENRLLESDTISGEGMVDADGGGSSLGSKLKSLSPESFLKLLEEIFKTVQTHLFRVSEVKRVIEWIMGNLDGHYAAASVATAIAHGAAVPEAALDSDGHVSSFVPHYSQNAARVSSIQGRGSDATSPSLSRNFRADILRENAEALFAACHAAHGRWAKIVGIRSQIHPKLRLQEFLDVYNINQEFISSTEKEVGQLLHTLSKHLLEEDVQAILGQVVVILYSQIFEAFSHLEISTPQAKSRLHYVVQRILGCIRSLPSDNLSKSDPPNWGLLDDFLAQHFESESRE